VLHQKEPCLCILRGALGSGKKLTLQHLASETDAKLILIDLDKQPAKPIHFESLINELLFLALVENNILCFSAKEPDSNALIPHIFEIVKQYKLGIFLLTESIRYDAALDGCAEIYIDYPTLNLEISAKFWEMFSKNYEYSSDIKWTELASRYVLTAGQIKSTLSSASQMAKFQNKLIDKKIISEAVLLKNKKRLEAIADRIDIFYTWDDLILNVATIDILKTACNRIKYRHTVEIEWGGKSAYGNGISILLYGQPGTGKTMSAQVIANELGLPLYRINLAQVVSKYIGETNKNIDMVFEEAKKSNVILFFDEADALFAKRTDVKDSNDRHANSESSYLLQKIEDYAGVSILASNLFHTFDEAFHRRISFTINLLMPKEAQRLKLWKMYIPPKAPLSQDMRLEYLAKELDISGSMIKSAALQAAHFAAEEDVPLNFTHFAYALWHELEKHGKSKPEYIRYLIQQKQLQLQVKE